MKEKIKNMEINKLKNLTGFYKSAVIILIVLILFFSATSYVFYWGFVDYKSVIRTNEFGQEVCLTVTNQGSGYMAGETDFTGYHLSDGLPNELFTHTMVVVIACLFFPLLDLIFKRKLSKNSDRGTIIEKYTLNKIIAVVLLIIFLVLFILSVFYSISYIKYEALVFEMPEGSGIWVRPHYTYDWVDGEIIYNGIYYSVERRER